MTNQVVIEIVGKDNASDEVRKVASSFGAIKTQVTSLLTSQVIQQAARELFKFGKEAVDATVKYADEVRRLSQLTGMTAEETSRLIQVADDYKISVEGLSFALRTMARKGVEPNIETLGQLSDQYLKLNPGQERAAFLMENFGRSGLQMAEMMSEGSAAILAANAAIDQNLILTQEAVDAAREYERSMDALGEKVEALQITLGNRLLPTLINVTDAFIAYTDVDPNFEDLSFWDQQVEAIRRVKEGLDALFPSNELMNDSATQSYTAWAKAAEGANEMGAAVDGVEESYSSLLQMSERLVDANEKNMKKMAYDALVAKLSVDGLTAEEKKMAEAVGLSTGVLTQGSINAAKSIETLNAQLMAGVITADQYAAALNAIPTDIKININQAITTTGSQSLSPDSGFGQLSGNAQGGTVQAGVPVMVGEVGREIFVPNVDGTIIPNDKLGQTGGNQTNYIYGAVTLQMNGSGSDLLLQR